MKGVHLALLFCIWLSFRSVYAGPPGKIVFYVALSGSDTWSGNLPAENNDSTDGPFRTLEKAKQAIEKWIEMQTMPQEGIEVIIRGGVYAIEETLLLTGKASGNGNSPVVWKNYPGEKVQLVGAKEIKGFYHVTDVKSLDRINKLFAENIVEIDLGAIGITDLGAITNRGKPGAELFFNNGKMPLSRWPNEGWAKIADVPQTGVLVNPGELPHIRFELPVGRHYGRFKYAGERPGRWSDIGSIVMHGYWTWDWYDEFLSIQSIDTATKEIFIKPPHSHYGLCKEQRYYALNILEELDQPGEWYIDRHRKLLFFWPPSSLDVAKIFLSLLDQPLIQLDHTENVHIEGIFFEFSRGSGVLINGGKNNLVAGCTFDNLGDIAVVINGGVKNGISGSNIYEVAGGGIELNGGDRKTLTPGGNFAINNDIHAIGQWIRTHQPAVKVSGVGNYIAHNLIHDAPNSGIALTGNEHIIEYNEMYDLALETGDVGAFYMGRDWTERGNIIRYNYFHDLKGPGVHDVNAVYLDDWASGTTVSGNIFSNCARGIMIGGGRDNVVDNNIFIDCKPAIHLDSRGLGWAKYYFDGTTSTLFERMDAMHYKHPPYSEKYPILLSLYDDEPAVAKHNTISHNVFFSGRWLDFHDGVDLAIVDVHDNLVAGDESGYKNEKDILVKKNPGIYNPGKKDFRLKRKALLYGFKEIPYDKIGLQQNRFRLEPIKSFIIK